MMSVAAPSKRPWRSLLTVVAVTLAAMAAVTAARHAQRSAGEAGLRTEVAALASPGDIQMVASVDCVYCAAARHWFQAARVPFSECEIERDAACAAVYAALGSPGTPVMVVRGKRIVGFDARAIAAALQAGRAPR